LVTFLHFYTDKRTRYKLYINKCDN